MAWLFNHPATWVFVVLAAGVVLLNILARRPDISREAEQIEREEAEEDARYW